MTAQPQPQVRPVNLWVPRPAPAAATNVWLAQWARVPPVWQTTSYPVQTAPFSEVFYGTDRYATGKVYDLAVEGAPQRINDELSWFIWLCWTEGHRKLEAGQIRTWSDTLADLLAQDLVFLRRASDSIADIEPKLIIAHHHRRFTRLHGRRMSEPRGQQLAQFATAIHAFVTARCSDRPWWDADVWDLHLDDSIPRRDHEPHADRPINFRRVPIVWLRNGLKFYLSRSLIHDQLTWTTAYTRVSSVGHRFGEYCHLNGIAHAAISTDRAHRKQVAAQFLSWLRTNPTRDGRPLKADTIAATQSHIHSFYEFMLDHQEDAKDFTGDPHWLELNDSHTRLWAADYGPRRRGNTPPIRYFTDTELAKMVACMPVLETPLRDPVTVTLPAGEQITASGLDDPEAARIWLIQAATGRRASETLMLDFDPLIPIEGVDIDAADEDQMVAWLRYQQTKVDGVDPVIPVERFVVELIRAQQADVIARHGAPTRYLFLGLGGNHRGTRARPFHSYNDVLRRLTAAVDLKGDTGQTLRFSASHHLRHTRATALLNAGVPLHVIQRYLGHRSPAMTMHYAQTLAAAAEEGFLNFKKIGADGRPVTIATRDFYDLANLDRRADRILPNGWCGLPPAKKCDKGNACLTCAQFATDTTHLESLQQQLAETIRLIEARQAQFIERRGEPMPDTNVWLAERNAEVRSLTQILEQLEATSALGLGVTGDPREIRTVTPVVVGPTRRRTAAIT